MPKNGQLHDVSSCYSVNSIWYHHFGNGVMKDTIIRVVDNFRIELAGHGVVQKKWLKRYWVQHNNC